MAQLIRPALISDEEIPKSKETKCEFLLAEKYAEKKWLDCGIYIER